MFERKLLSLALEPTTDWSIASALQVLCPGCQADYVHCEGAYAVSGYDHYCAWEGRGDVLRVQWWCEGGHAWEVCFGFHKGQTVCFVEEVPIPTYAHHDHGAALHGALREARVRAETRAETLAQEREAVRKRDFKALALKKDVA